MPYTKNGKDPIDENKTDDFDLGALTDKYSVSPDVDLSGVENLFRELSGEKIRSNAERDKKDMPKENIDDIVNEFEKTMPNSDRPKHNPRVVYSEDGNFSGEKKPVTVKKQSASRSAPEDKNVLARPMAGIPIGKRKSSGSRVIFSADESGESDKKQDVIENSSSVRDPSESETKSASKDVSIRDSKSSTGAVPISKKAHFSDKNDTDNEKSESVYEDKKTADTAVIKEKKEENKNEIKLSGGSDSEDFADILNTVDVKDDKAESKKETADVVSDENKNENIGDDVKTDGEKVADGFFDDVEEVKIESIDPNANNVFTEEDMLLYEKERNKALGKKDPKGAFKRFIKNVIPQKGDSSGEIVRKIILLVSALTILVCAIWFGNYYFQHLNEKDQLKKLGAEITTDPDADLAAQWAKIKAEFPDVDFPDGMNIKYARAYAVNQDMVGKLKIPGTAIDIPIVQCKDDTADYQYYLKHSFQKKDSKYGTPFMSVECDPFNLGDSTVIHGHNMYDNLMFADLEKYYKIEGYRESPIIQYNTLFKDYNWKIFAIIITNGSASGDNGYVFDFTAASFGSKQNKADFINGLLERSIYDIDVDVNADDKLLVLNTCAYVFNGAHLGVAARLVRDGESTDVDVSKATENEDARYPQAWYDAKNQTNPYKDAYRWHQTG